MPSSNAPPIRAVNVPVSLMDGFAARLVFLFGFLRQSLGWCLGKAFDFVAGFFGKCMNVLFVCTCITACLGCIHLQNGRRAIDAQTVVKCLEISGQSCEFVQAGLFYGSTLKILNPASGGGGGHGGPTGSVAHPACDEFADKVDDLYDREKGSVHTRAVVRLFAEQLPRELFGGGARKFTNGDSKVDRVVHCERVANGKLAIASGGYLSVAEKHTDEDYAKAFSSITKCLYGKRVAKAYHASACTNIDVGRE
jgi:hypothetical protein